MLGLGLLVLGILRRWPGTADRSGRRYRDWRWSYD